ncbi:MAG: hypothetical protein MUO82_07860 [Candidatus Thermoplasmatota archaeon]|nr:hypothetical protein [Candidatus Thermoplasmatota archaeon]
MGTPSYLNSLAFEINKQYDTKTLSINKIITGAENLTSKMRKRLEDKWNAEVFQNYGMVELGNSIAGECKEKNGLHVSQLDFFIELIDPETGRNIKPGEKGEIVVTTLSRTGMPLIRYRTKDEGYIMKEKCICGLPFQRIKILGRLDDTIIIGSGDKLHPSIIENNLFSIPYINDFRMKIDKKNNKDRFNIIVETTNNDKINHEEILKHIIEIPEIYNGIYSSKTISMPSVEFVKPNSLKKYGNKIGNRIIDNRKT